MKQATGIEFRLGINEYFSKFNKYKDTIKLWNSILKEIDMIMW